jgi:predicted glycoside hydrolase/deacetylase ChbG (UPF0249 family)
VKRLIVTADDVGLERGMTEGAIRAHQQGIVTACSLVANGADFDDAVARLRDVPTLEVGAHLALVEERALTTGAPMPKSYLEFVLSRRRVDVERELRAQLDKLLATGLRITHLNGHQHLHMLPSVFAIVRRLADEHAIPYVRVVNDQGGRGGIARRASIGVLSMLGRRVDRNRRTIGVMEAGHLTAERLVALFDHVGGVTELVTHPGVGVRGYDWGYAWDEETNALCAPYLREALDARGISLVRPSTPETS